MKKEKRFDCLCLVKRGLMLINGKSMGIQTIDKVIYSGGGGGVCWYCRSYCSVVGLICFALLECSCVHSVILLK